MNSIMTHECIGYRCALTTVAHFNNTIRMNPAECQWQFYQIYDVWTFEQSANEFILIEWKWYRMMLYKNMCRADSMRAHIRERCKSAARGYILCRDNGQSIGALVRAPIATFVFCFLPISGPQRGCGQTNMRRYLNSPYDIAEMIPLLLYSLSLASIRWMRTFLSRIDSPLLFDLPSLRFLFHSKSSLFFYWLFIGIS